MNKKLLAATLLTALSVSAANPQQAKAAGRSVTVTLPHFPVVLDGVAIDSEKLRYPLLTYNDITYIPMTWSISQATGLRLKWSQESGLDVDLDMPAAEKPDLEQGGSFRQDRSYRAKVVDYPVKVNQQAIDNGSQTYPLLEFQDITYFPLTWNYAVDDFRWKLGWDAEDGLSIATAQRRYMTGIIYDDDRYLYTYVHNVPNRLFRIPKSLQGSIELVSEEESKRIQAARDAGQAAPAGAIAQPQAKLTTYRDHQLWLNDKPLISVEKYEEGNAAFRKQSAADAPFVYDESAYDAGADTKVFSFRIPVGPSNPFETPSEQPLVVVHKDEVQVVPGLKSPSVYKVDSGLWLSEMSPTRLSARTAQYRGKVLWIGADGKSRDWNEQLKAQYLRVLKADGGKLLVQAYELYRPENAPPATTGYYWLHGDGTYEKIAGLTEATEVKGSLFIADNLDAYVDRDNRIYVVRNNTVTIANNGTSRTWWDYELKEVTEQYPNAGY
ncbi:hypothetical protein [Gordoniibacillus kamchatkensis]|uniref:hypothetical protein n=1 Tax=Gordoniibacillus kamchatkensis TaxID=1590651 RepID=UPI0006968269|nr:hypothetical protein [Paenibacillus sp. VKM B-2647]